MKKAIQMGYNEFFAERCAMAAAAGFDGVAIDFNIDATRGLDFDRATEDILSVLEKNGVCAVQTHLPFYDLRVSAEEKDAEVEERMKKVIRTTGAIGAKCAVVHPRTSISSGYCRRTSFEENRKSIGSYLDTAVTSGVTIAIENMPIFRSLSTAMPFYTSDYYDLCELCDSFASENVKICWDFGHANLMGFDHAEALRFVGARLACMHMHNNFGNDDNHFAPDLGTADFNKLMPVLTEIGYTGALTLETRFYNTEKRVLESFMRHAYETLGWLEDMM